MKFIKIQLPGYYAGLVQSAVQGNPKLQKFDIDFIEDVMCITAMGKLAVAKYLVSEEEIALESARLYQDGKIRSISQKEGEFSKLKFDLIDFAGSPFLKELNESSELSLEQKFELVCKILEALIDASEQSQTKEGKEMNKQMKEEAKEGGAKNQQGQLGRASGIYT